MKKLSLILVALATMVMVGCKPLTGSTVCTHNWDLTDDVAPTCAANGVKTYTCTLCGDKQYEPIPATGNHTWVDTDCAEDKKVTSAKYYEVSEGVYKLEKVEVSPKYKCSICGEEHDKTIAFFTTDDHKTTIGKAAEVTMREWFLPIDEELTMFYNSYCGDSSIKYKCSCDDCDNCMGDSCFCYKLTCIRFIHGIQAHKDWYFFGDYYIIVPNN